MVVSEKIKKIKYSRLPLSERTLIKYLFNLTEVRKWETDTIVIYKYKNNKIFEYDIDKNYLYMDSKLYDKIYYSYINELGFKNAFFNTTYFIEDLIHKYLNSNNIKRDILNIEKEKYNIQYNSMVNNNLFNSVSGKCKKIIVIPYKFND